MFRRIIALSVLLSPLVLMAATPPAGAAVGSPCGVTARIAAAAVRPAVQLTLRLGARGGAVVTLQHRLAALHYFDLGSADGVFGPGPIARSSRSRRSTT
jgi:peptidoglycan hydrolase-like protein with peptidoglycan-binding domain